MTLFKKEVWELLEYMDGRFVATAPPWVRGWWTARFPSAFDFLHGLGFRSGGVQRRRDNRGSAVSIRLRFASLALSRFDAC